MSYEQAMRHSRNHRKDRFYQQCGGPVKPLHPELTDKERNQFRADNYDRVSRESMDKIIASASKIQFPIYVRQHGDGFWSHDDRPNGGEQINDIAELSEFARQYV